MASESQSAMLQLLELNAAYARVFSKPITVFQAKAKEDSVSYLFIVESTNLFMLT